MSERPFIPVNVAILTVSDTRTLQTDTSGQAAVDLLEEAGHNIVARHIITDSQEAVSDQLGKWIADSHVDVIIATGGTGITQRDVTPEALAPHVTKAIPGFGEMFRWVSYREIGAATIQSRAAAALCGTTLAFVLPGSTGAVKTAMNEIILPQLDNRTRPCNFVELLPRIRGE